MARTRRLYRQKGFTLIEMLIGLLLSGIVLAAVVGSFQTQHRSYLAQDYVAEAQQNVRAGMNMMVEEIRMAGYDPADGSADAKIESMSSSSIGFTMDLDGNGDHDDDGEYITYGLYTSSGVQKLGRKTLDPVANPGHDNKPVAENVVGLEFRYFDSSGAVTAIAANVRSVEVTLAVRASAVDPELLGGAAQTFTTPGGATWTIPAGYRWRASTTRLVCRNLGL